MKLILLTALALFTCNVVSELSAAEKTTKPRKGKLNHVVAFKFKSTASKEQIDKAVAAFRALPKTIKQIDGFEWGTNVSPEKHDKGFTHGFILTFKTEKDRDEYLVHADHKAFGSMLGPILDDVMVIDFWAEK